MKQQILIIHGGEAPETHEEYIEELRNKEISLEKMRLGGWKENLESVLGMDYDILLPKMPNSQMARYKEWKIFFERIIPLLDESVILLGHSLGGIFLAKYLAEENFPKKIKGTFLVSAPFSTEEKDPLVDFNLPPDLDKFSEQGGKIFLYHSEDDPSVPFLDLAQYQTLLPNATARIFKDRQHFNMSQFPEIVADIESLK